MRLLLLSNRRFFDVLLGRWCLTVGLVDTFVRKVGENLRLVLYLHCSSPVRVPISGRLASYPPIAAHHHVAPFPPLV